MIECPNCRAVMTSKPEEAFGAIARPIDVDICMACGLFWFDATESVRLTPRAVLSLFQMIGQAGAAKSALLSSPRCPRCRDPLSFTHDVQRMTRFTYWRCARGDGQLITFTQFLAEKNFIRAPSPAELAKLREHVRQINCSQCGAPIDLANESACSHCGAPVSIIDADGVAKALKELQAGGAAGDLTPVATTTAISDAQVDAMFDLDRLRRHEGGDDLVAIGATAIAELVSGWLLSRL